MKQKIKDFFERKTRRLVRWAFSSRVRVYKANYVVPEYEIVYAKEREYLEEKIKSELKYKLIEALMNEELVDIDSYENPYTLTREYRGTVTAIK